MTVLVYSACIGGRDEIHAPVPQRDVDVAWCVVTDDAVEDVPSPWVWMKTHPLVDEHPNMTAKRVKTHPDTFDVAPGACEAFIWIDASMEITNSMFVAQALASLRAGDAPLAAFAHPRRDCVYEEGAASLGPEGLGRYTELPIEQQLASYREEGYPEHAGLWAGGAIVWDATPEAYDLAHAWFDECERWGYQDQLALPVVCARAGYRPTTFPVPLIERHARRRSGLINPWLKIHNHVPGTENPA